MALGALYNSLGMLATSSLRADPWEGRDPFHEKPQLSDVEKFKELLHPSQNPETSIIVIACIAGALAVLLVRGSAFLRKRYAREYISPSSTIGSAAASYFQFVACYLCLNPLVTAFMNFGLHHKVQFGHVFASEAIGLVPGIMVTIALSALFMTMVGMKSG